MSMPPARRVPVWAAWALAGCAGTAPPEAPGPVAAPPLEIRIVYPRLAPDSAGTPSGAFASGDSAFVFGAVSRPAAAVTVNGEPARVAATGGWLAWIPLPDDTVAAVTVRARDGADSAASAFTVRLPPRFRPPSAGAWVDTASLAPRGRIWVRPGEGVGLRATASPGASVRLLVDDSTVVGLVPTEPTDTRSAGELAFGTVVSPQQSGGHARYGGWLTGPAGGNPGPVLEPGPVADSAAPVLEVALAGDTVRVPWPLGVAVLDGNSRVPALLSDSAAPRDGADGIVPGRPAPAGVYHWFFPNGTVTEVSGRVNDRVRVQLSARSAAWVDARDVVPLPAGTPPLRGTVRALRLLPGEESVTLRVSLPGRVPFRVDEDGRRLVLTVYGVAPNASWVQYGPEDPLVSFVGFSAEADDEARITVELGADVWGYRTRWDGPDLMLEIRRPPAIDPRRPLRGIRVALDPGHPPVGATGPTGAYEGDVVLAVAREAARLFRAAGAEVVLLRDDTLPVDLGERPRAAERAGAHLLVSVHANALPDGVNPFENSGTSTYYFHPRAAPFARFVNRALVRGFGSRDLGIGRGDLALARPTWMPAILVEGLFLMVPDEEAVLVSPEGRRRYAEGLVEGTRAFLAHRARQERP